MSVQSMTTTKTANVEGTLQQIYALAGAGADIVRCTCNEAEAAEGLAHIVPRSPVPIVADIHFHVEMALAALVGHLRRHKIEMIDCQQNTSHLASLGGREIARKAFIAHVRASVDAAPIPWRFDKTVLLDVAAPAA